MSNIFKGGLGRRLLRTALIGGGSTLALCAAAPQAFAQAADGSEEVIVVRGIRASMQSSMNLKRNTAGVVDAISAADIGRFPDTNLSESLQRITGVSINRVNGEGSEVTVRGFGGGYNLVTLNGRQMPTANVATVGADQSGDFSAGTSRSFDFSNLASEGVSALEVFKTGRAQTPTGGIGATINIRTRRPLDTEGFSATVGAKAQYDTSVVNGDQITPELSGLMSWSDPSRTFGVGLFGSYQVRDSATRSATVNDWNVERATNFFNTANGRVRSTTVSENAPTGQTLVSFPNDSRYHFSENHRERTNAQLVFQYRPIESLTLTADYTYAHNATNEQRSDQTNWFNRPFDGLTFDTTGPVASAVFLRENIAGVKDIGFEQQYRAVADELNSFGINAAWEVAPNLHVNLDIASSKSESVPDSPNGASSTLVSIGAPVVAAHSVDFRSGVPVQTYTVNDALRGNNNGRLDIGDLGTQVARTFAATQTQDLDQQSLSATYDLNDDWSIDAGVSHINSTFGQTTRSTYQALGDWGISNPGDVNKIAASLVSTYDLGGLFNHYKVGQSNVAFRANAVDLYNALSAAYRADGNPMTTAIEAGHPVDVNGSSDNSVEEEVTSYYVAARGSTDLMGRALDINVGVRYETTDVTAVSQVTAPTAIIWQADNDFTRTVASGTTPNTGTGSYNNVLPSIDLTYHLSDDLVARASYSKTIGRTDYGNLIIAENAGQPNRPTAIGGVAGGNAGNPGLLPLESSNFDFSFEYYYGPSSYVSLGYFNKSVDNFVGNAVVTRNLFGLRDVTSGAAGSRSGAALAELTRLGLSPTDVNLFTMTALLQSLGTISAASTTFMSHFVGSGTTGNLDQAYADSILAAIDLTPNSTDPLMNFNVTIPVNNKTANIDGWEFAIQHFFGETGFGVAANYTMVNGDVAADIGSDPTANQFALSGLGDSANLTLIYEKDAWSARLAYNWRDAFLAGLNRGGGRSPVFVDTYSTIDLSVTYDYSDAIQFSFEGINLNGESTYTYGRDYSNTWFAQENDPRYMVGVRYKF